MKCPHCSFEAPETEQFCPNCGASSLAPQTPKKISAISSLPLGTILNSKYRIEAILKTDSINVYKASSNSQQDLFLIEETTVDDKSKSNFITRLVETFRSIRPSQSHTNETTKDKKPEAIVEQLLSLRKKYELLASLDTLDFQKTFDYFVIGDKEYLVLENAVARSLFDIVTHDLPTEDQAIDIAVDLCDRVDKIHRAGYVHLNIDPNSIYLLDGHVRLFNFERVARVSEGRHEYLTTDGYSAPELLSIDTAVDVRADIYSIGAVLYWMISGKNVPFTGVSFLELMPSVSSLELGRILTYCLAHNPDQRYISAGELKDKLATYQEMQKRNLHFDTACITDTGMVRKNNEDSCFVLEKAQSTDLGVDSHGIYLIADGMGGEQSGEVASTKAVAEISSFILESLKSAVKGESFSNLVKQAIEKANSEMYNMARSNPQLSNMGTTLTMGLRINNELYLGHVGDSRAYLIRSGEIRQLTQDHSVVAGLLKAGMITPDEAIRHPDQGKIYRCLGTAPSVIMDTYKEVGNEEKLTLMRGDSLVFCTDGMTAHVSNEEIMAEAERPTSAYDACRHLAWLANQRGGTDNVTVIVVKSTDNKREEKANV
jgi:serine/threonine protein phosphatase PrpC